MTYEQERRRWEAIKADQALIDQAARFLRHHAIQSQYAGLQRQEVAFGLAAILDELARHLPDLNEGVRWQTVQACLQMLGSEGRPGRDPEGTHVVA
jgi:HEAT repeat protein